MSSNDPIVIVEAKRTPIGRFLGSLAEHTAVDLGVIVAREVAQALPPGVRIDQVILGCARQAGTGPNPARQVAVRAGLGDDAVAHTINMACASGMEAIAAAARLLTLGEAEWILAGGMESMSRVPFLAERFRTGYRMGNTELIDGMYRDGFQCPLADQLMGRTAETLAERYEIPRDEQDRYALESQTKAAAAQDAGHFESQLVPVPVKSGSRAAKSGATWALEADEHLRRGVRMESLAKLPPVFAAEGSVTAGNASGITDGAAALLVTRRSLAGNAGAPVLATLRGYASAGVDPRIMGIGPVPATRNLLARTGEDLGSVDLIELNEAFAAQVLAVDRDLGLDRECLNVNGGAIALGHPIGCTGARIVVTLLHELQRRDARRGLATLCVSGGLGMSMLFDRA